MRRQACVLVVALAFGPPARAAEDKEEKVDGYLEWRQGDLLIADGQKVRVSPSTKFKGKAEARDVASIPLGYELKAKGLREDGGVLLAREIEAKPNGGALFESDVKTATDEAERRAVRAGRFLEGDGPGATSAGRLYTEGPEVDRVRRIVDGLCPPYVDAAGFRVYVIENREWNAFAMGNYSIYVFTGLLQDLDDDEVAIVLGHEMVHATHEHTRRQFKKQMWIQLAALGLAGVEEADHRRQEGSGGGPAHDRIRRSRGGQRLRPGLRGPGRPRRAPLRLRGRLRHHEGPETLEPLREEVRRNRQGRQLLLRRSLPLVGAGGQPREADRLQLSRGTEGVGPRPAEGHGGPTQRGRSGTRAAFRARPRSGHDARARPDVERGRTQGDQARHDATAEVQRLLGPPKEQLAFGTQTKWTYPSLSVVFEGGKVKEVKF